MNKKLMFTLFILVVLLCPISTKAMSAGDIRNRNECPNFELANAKSDGGLDKVECYNSYDEAKNAMYNNPSQDLVIIENGMIINAKYAVADIDCIRKTIIDVYDNNYSNSTSGHYIYSDQPDDAVILDYDYNTKRIRIKISGLDGWITKYNGGNIVYDVVPYVWAKTLTYYQVNNERITHVFPGNVYGTSGYSTEYLTIDIKPDMLSPNNYFSYDGHYFYTDFKTMVNDYRNNTYANSVNPNNPYYNFYQYLSFRTKTVYNADNLNQFINNRKRTNNSKLINTGEAFINAQNNFGTNAALMLSIGINESGWGESTISQDKNNLFGLNAVDSNPYLASDAFNSPADCIEIYSYVWLDNGYLLPGDYTGRFRGSNVGNKSEGLNVRYASGPYWGETAASFYYQLDKMFDFQERKQKNYGIAVLNNQYPNGVYAKRSPNGENVNSKYYKYVEKDSVVVILGEEKDNRGITWYKIQSDPNLDSNFNYSGSSKDVPKTKYNWNSYAYVSSENFTKISDPATSYPVNNNENNNQQSEHEINNPSVATIVTRASYKYTSDTISGINLNTDANSIITNLQNQGAKSVVVTTANDEPKVGAVKTGDRVHIINNNGKEVLSIVIYGDIDGDGNISAVDYVKIKNHIMDNGKLNGIYSIAADVNQDGNISAVDYVNVKNHIMGQNSVIK